MFGPWVLRHVGRAPFTSKAGTRSLLAFWLGGAASSASGAPSTAGFRSLFAFWAGGGGSTITGVTPLGTMLPWFRRRRRH